MKNTELLVIVAGHVAGGLVAAHGVDHGGVAPQEVANRALAIAGAILDTCEEDCEKVQPEPQPEPWIDPPAPVDPPKPVDPPIDIAPEEKPSA